MINTGFAPRTTEILGADGIIFYYNLCPERIIEMLKASGLHLPQDLSTTTMEVFLKLTDLEFWLDRNVPVGPSRTAAAILTVKRREGAVLAVTTV